MNSVAAVNYKVQFPKSLKPFENFTLRSPQSESQNLQLLLKKCEHLIQFKQVHTQIIKTSSDHNQSISLLSKLVESLVDSASTSDSVPRSTTHIDYAAKVFNEMSEPTTFVFNTMVRGYSLLDMFDEGINVYIEMRCRGLKPDKYTYPFLLKACTALIQGKGVHSLLVKIPRFGMDIYSQTSLVSFYSAHGDLEYARVVFDRMRERNVVSWTAMIMGYVKGKMYNEGLSLFCEMKVQDVEINEITLVYVLRACAHLQDIETGKWVHGFIDKNQGLLIPTVATGLVEMYVKCGYIDKASQVFEKLSDSQRNVDTWSSIIVGLAKHGYAEEALVRFEQMQEAGVEPDDITFIGVLSACTNSKKVERGRRYFNSMRVDYGIEPDINHYGCLIDLLGRAGHLEEAYQVVNDMPFKPNGDVLRTILNACCIHANVELAETAMEQLVKLEPLNKGNHFIMSKVYAVAERWEDVARMNAFFKDQGISETQ